MTVQAAPIKAQLITGPNITPAMMGSSLSREWIYFFNSIHTTSTQYDTTLADLGTMANQEADDVTISGGIISGVSIYNSSIYLNSINLEDIDGSNNLILTWNEDDSADRHFYIQVNSGDRALNLYEDFTIGDGFAGTLTYSADGKTATVEDDATIDQDLTQDATPTHAQMLITDDPTLENHVTTYGFVAKHYITEAAVREAVVEEHNNLIDLDGGTDQEYYHLTSSDYTKVVAFFSGSGANIDNLSGTAGNDFDWNGVQLNNLADPTHEQDAATMYWVATHYITEAELPDLDILSLYQQDHINDPDGTLPDATQKIKDILDLLENTGLMAA